MWLWLVSAGTVMAAVEEGTVKIVRDGDTYTVTAKNASMRDIVDALKKESNIAIDMDPLLLNEQRTLNLKKVSYEKIVNTIAGSNAMIYERTDDGGYRLVSARLTGRQEYVAPTLDNLSRRERKDHAAMVQKVKDITGQHDGIFGFAGELNYEQAKALSTQRMAQVQALIEQLKALGPGGARAMLDVYKENPGTRESLAMIEALAYIDDPEAIKVLAQLYDSDSKYSLLREIVGSMGHRPEAETVAVLSGILDSQSDERLRAAAVQALSGRPESYDALWTVIRSPSESSDVRAEAIRSMGLIADEKSMTALTQVAAESGYALPLRKSAIQELGRSYGEESIPSLQMLMESPEESIRQNVVRSLAKVDSPEATALLQTVATTDVSTVVRAHAEAAVNSRGTAN